MKLYDENGQINVGDALRAIADYIDHLEGMYDDISAARSRGFKMLMEDIDVTKRGPQFIPKFNFELYETLLTPVERYMDTKTASEGYNNLLYRNIPVTVEN
jgi:hypothetical protein